MINKLTDLSFEDWILFVFCWPENGAGSIGGNAWQMDEYWAASPAIVVSYLTQLFEQPVMVLADYGDGEIAQGLWDVAEYAAALTATSVPLSDRLRCIDALTTLFRDLFAVRCSPHLGHRSETGESPLNTICYMWWDLFAINPVPEERDILLAAALRSQTASLHLPSMACQEAALHGFGHYWDADAAAIQTIIDDWLQQHPDLRPDLRNYALSARGGCVL